MDRPTTRRRLIRAGIGTSALVALVACAPAVSPTAAPQPTAAATTPLQPTAAPAKPASPSAKPDTTAPAKSATTATPVPAPSPSAKGPTEAELFEAAKREGKVVVYTTLAVEPATKIFAQFEAKYLGVKVEIVRGSVSEVTERATTERRAGRTIADILQLNTPTFQRLIEEGLIEPYYPSGSERIPRVYRDAEGRWYAHDLVPAVIAINTQLMKIADAPRTWEDLGDPRFRGQIMIDQVREEVLITLWQVKYGGDLAKTRAVFQRVAENDPQMVSGNSQTLTLLAAGQRPIFATAFAHLVEDLKAKGAPVDWVKDGEGVITASVGGVAKNAPHPNAARLLMTWILSEDGQRVLASDGRIVSLPGVGKTLELKTSHNFRPEFIRVIPEGRRVWQEVFKLR